MFSKLNLWVLLVGLFLLSTAFFVQVRADEDDDYEDVDDDYEAENEEETGGDIDENDVVVLTDSNFNKIVEESKFALVEFYAPWCGHCKNLAPEYAKAATEIKASNPEVIIAKVDATENEELAERFEIEGFPTLKWFVDGEVSEYTGGRTQPTIVSWIKKKTGPPAVELKDVEALEQAQKDNEVIVLGFFKKLEGSEYDNFVKTARLIDEAAFFETTDADVAKAAGLKTCCTHATVMKNFEIEEASKVMFTGKFQDDELKDFVNSHRGPLIPPFNEKYQPYIFDGDHRQVFVVASKETLGSDSVMKPLKSVGEKNRGKLMFVQVDTSDENAARVIEYFGVGELKEGESKLIGYHLDEGTKYFYKGELKESELQKWAAQVIDGTAEVEYKSDEIPQGEDAKDGEVLVVVGKSVDDVVKDAKKDVLLEVYAPWCGHCKQLAPIYKKLAKRFSIVESVVIAKMDGTTNEHADIKAEGFPTLLFFPAEEGAKPILYEGGDRSLAALTKFIKEHAKIPYELPKKKKEESEENVEL